MIKSSGNTIIGVEKCKWSQPGSKDLLKTFLQVRDPWMEATNALCEKLGVTIMDYSNLEEYGSAWLGTGANGRAFRLIGGQVVKIVLGEKSDEVEKEYRYMLGYCRSKDIASFVFPVVEESFHRGEIEGVKYAGYLLAQEGQKITLPVSNEMKRQLAVSLCELHSHNVNHGDPRIQNVLILDGVKWIDFRLSHFVLCTTMRSCDVEILFKSLGGVVNDAVRKEISAYADDPTGEKLYSILLKTKLDETNLDELHLDELNLDEIYNA